MSAIKYSQHASSDIEASSEAIYAEVADKMFDNRTMGRDLLALAALFFVIVTYSIQNPLLQYGTRFGSAFRNATLQPTIAVGLILCAAVLIYANRESAARRHPLILGSAIVLSAYTLIMALAILLNFNLFGALVGAPQDLFTARLTSDTPTALLDQALPLATFGEYLALVSVVILWQPWERIAVYRRGLRKQGAALVIGVLVVLLWEVVIYVFKIEQFLLPRPTVIGATFVDTYPKLISAGWNTFQNAFWGFILGCGAGILTGIVSSRFVSFSKALLPVAIAINAIPIIALAPIFNNWFGALNPFSKIAIVAVMVYFPAMISTVRGLDLGRCALAGVDEILRGDADRHFPQAAAAERAAVHLLGAESRHHAGDDRRDCQRVLRRIDGGLRLAHPRRCRVVQVPGGMVGDFRRRAVWHPVLSGGFQRRANAAGMARLVPREMSQKQC